MVKVYSVKAMRESDEFTIDCAHIAQSELVGRAGSAIAEEIIKRIPPCRVLAVAGNGNNGADVLAAAKILLKNGYKTDAFIFNEKGSVCYEKNLQNFIGGIYKDTAVINNGYGLIIDGIFGTGLNRKPEGIYSEVIEKINASSAFKVSADIPSGLNGDNGLKLDVCIKADLTVAIGEYKTGYFLNDGLDFCGELVRRDIGIIAKNERCFLSEVQDFRCLFGKRLRNTNKGNYGRAALIAGSKQYCGAAFLSLAGLSGLRTGAGYSYLVAPQSALSVSNSDAEVIKITLPEIEDETIFDREILDKIMHTADCIAFGMGVGTQKNVREAVEYLIKKYKKRLIIDADGLNALCQCGTEILKEKRDCEILITPHVGEFARLCDCSVKKIQENSISAAEDFANKYNVTVLLKSASTVITDGKRSSINITGCAAMAKGGSGDVLSGLLSGMLARCDNFFNAVSASAYIFGKAGERAAAKLNEYSVLARDIAAQICGVISDITAL